MLVFVPTRRWIIAGWSSLTQPSREGVLTSGATWAWPWTASRVKQDNERLRQENARLIEQVVTTQAALETLRDAQKLTELITPLQRTTLLATVIGYSPDPGIQSITLNRGKGDGVVEGMAVLANDGLVVGKIISVGDASCTVLLLTDSQSSLLARVNNDPRSPGVIKGERGIGLQMELLPRNDNIPAGVAVVTSGAEARIPPNLPVGTIDRALTRQGDVFQNAVLSQPIAGYLITTVAIVLR